MSGGVGEVAGAIPSPRPDRRMEGLAHATHYAGVRALCPKLIPKKFRFPGSEVFKGSAKNPNSVIDTNIRRRQSGVSYFNLVAY